LIIRDFRPEDADSVSAIVRKTMRISNADDYPLERLQPLIDYFSPEKIRQLSRERHCLVAEAEGVIVGTVSLETTDDTSAELCTFFVHPDHQRTGIGSKLLAAVEEIAQVSRIDNIRVDSSITGASFYLRRGYRQTGADIEGTAGRQIGLIKMLAAR
jgi:N-acetylglutamate synthase-like GNAT family acetyltransferase